MVAPNARDFLKKENELLDELANRVAMLANKATGSKRISTMLGSNLFDGIARAMTSSLARITRILNRAWRMRSKFLKASAIPLRGTAVSLTIGERILTMTSLSGKKCFKGYAMLARRA